METSIILAFVAAVASIAGAVLSFWFSLQREQAGDWRKVKFEHYREFMTALSGMTGSNDSLDSRKKFAQSATTIQLVASKQVIKALHELVETISGSNRDRLQEQHDQLVSNLIREIRSDLGKPRGQSPADLPVRLYGPGVSSTKN